jgi:hypothetical protein
VRNEVTKEPARPPVANPAIPVAICKIFTGGAVDGGVAGVCAVEIMGKRVNKSDKIPNMAAVFLEKLPNIFMTPPDRIDLPNAI